jgi:hypothetical protein
MTASPPCGLDRKLIRRLGTKKSRAIPALAPLWSALRLKADIDRSRNPPRTRIRHGKPLLDHFVNHLVIAKTSAHRSVLNQSGRISCRLS